MAFCAKRNIMIVSLFIFLFVCVLLFIYIHFSSFKSSNLVKLQDTDNLLSKHDQKQGETKDTTTTMNYRSQLPNSSDTKNKYLTGLRFFDSSKFRLAQRHDLQPSNTCVETRLKPTFTICVYQKDEDKYVSSSILDFGMWEPEISLLIKDILIRYARKDVIVLDIGANLGIHGLFAAKIGYKVWAIEPQPRNLIRMFRSALKSNVLDKLTFVQNGIDDIRRSTYMDIDRLNNGGSFISLTNQSEHSNTLRNTSFPLTIRLQTVLLKDIFYAIRHHTSSLPSAAVMKIDIENFECRAFLGSPEVLSPTQDIPLLAVIMEWTFPGENDLKGERCPKEKVVKLVKLFLHNGYTPFRLSKNGLTKLDLSNFGVKWHGINVAWLTSSILKYYT